MSLESSGIEHNGFGDRYRKAFVALGQPLQAKDEFEEAFLDANLPKSIQLPTALRDYYLVAGNEHHLNQCFNRLLPPEKIFLDMGRIVFMEENQSAVYWGVNDHASDENPLVEQGVNVADETLDWYAESIDCATFLELHLYLQASFGGGFKHSVTAPITPEAKQLLGQQLRVVGTMGALTAYALDQCAICVMKWDDGWRVFAGFHTKKMLTVTARELNLSWEDL